MTWHTVYSVGKMPSQSRDKINPVIGVAARKMKTNVHIETIETPDHIFCGCPCPIGNRAINLYLEVYQMYCLLQ